MDGKKVRARFAALARCVLPVTAVSLVAAGILFVILAGLASALPPSQVAASDAVGKPASLNAGRDPRGSTFGNSSGVEVRCVSAGSRPEAPVEARAHVLPGPCKCSGAGCICAFDSCGENGAASCNCCKKCSCPGKRCPKFSTTSDDCTGFVVGSDGTRSCNVHPATEAADDAGCACRSGGCCGHKAEACCKSAAAPGLAFAAALPPSCLFDGSRCRISGGKCACGIKCRCDGAFSAVEVTCPTCDGTGQVKMQP